MNEDFNEADTEADLEFWNLYMPKWAPIAIVPDPVDEKNKCLELRDEEPYDYALAERAFPESAAVTVAFRVRAQQVGSAALDCEVQDRRGHRPMRLHLDAKWLSLDLGKESPDPVPIALQKWLTLRLALDCRAQKYDLAINGDWVRKDIPFVEKVDTLERLVFRTGPWRGDVRASVVDGQPSTLGLDQEDLPGADQKAPLSVYLIDDVRTKSPKQ